MHPRTLARRLRVWAERFRPPRTIKLTRSGKATLALAVGLGLAAVNSGNNLLYLLLSLLLAAVVLSGILSEVALRGVRLRVIPPGRLFAGETQALTLHLRQSSRWAALDLSLEVLGRQGEQAFETRGWLHYVPARGQSQLRLPLAPTERGWLELQRLHCATRFPFGLIEKRARFSLEQRLLVYPERRGALPRQPLAATASAGARTRQGQELWRELRAYREGDALAQVAWKRSAALDRMVSIEREADHGLSLRATLDRRSPELEARIKQTAALLQRALDTQRGFELVILGEGGQLRLSPGAPPNALWRKLALLEPAG